MARVINARMSQRCQQCGVHMPVGTPIVKKAVGWCHAASACGKIDPENSPVRPAGAPPCPACGTNMMVRINSHTSEPFWGCSLFGKKPVSCRGTLRMTDLERSKFGGASSTNEVAPQARTLNLRTEIEELTMRLQEEKAGRALDKSTAAKQMENMVEMTEKRVQAELQAERDRQVTAFKNEYPVPEFLKEYVEVAHHAFLLNCQTNRSINIGVLGNSGTGKTALIRVMLKQLNCSVAGQNAPVSCIEGDGTFKPTPYELGAAFNGSVYLWDLPGQGTSKVPSQTYLRKMGLKYFDALLVVTDGRWTENDGGLLCAIRFADIWYKVVRTKIDLAVEDGKEDHNLSQGETLDNVRQTLSCQLSEEDSKIHLVTSRPKYWADRCDGTAFGKIDQLCNDLMQYVEDRLCPGSDVRPEDSASCVSGLSSSNESFLVLGANTEGKCFLTSTLVYAISEPSGCEYIIRAGDLTEGTLVRGFHHNVRVKKVAIREERRKLIKLIAGAARLTVTDTHRVATNASSRPCATTAASDLKTGDRVHCVSGPVNLTAVRETHKNVEIAEVSFKPDEPIMAFDPPTDQILSKGQREGRRGLKHVQSGNKQTMGYAKETANLEGLPRGNSSADPSFADTLDFFEQREGHKHMNQLSTSCTHN